MFVSRSSTNNNGCSRPFCVNSCCKGIPDGAFPLDDPTASSTIRSSPSGSNSSSKKMAPPFVCNDCGVRCRSEWNFHEHLNGSRHKQRMARNNNKGGDSHRWDRGTSGGVKPSPFTPSKGVFSLGNDAASFGSNMATKTSVTSAPAAAVAQPPSLFKPSKGVFSFGSQPGAATSFATWNNTSANSNSPQTFLFAPTKSEKSPFSFSSPPQPNNGNLFSFKNTVADNTNCPSFSFNNSASNDTCNSMPLAQFRPNLNLTNPTNQTSSFCFKSENCSLSFGPKKTSMQTDKDQLVSGKTQNGTIHATVKCDGCGMSPLVGIRYRCSMCPNFDLCMTCLEENETSISPKHDTTHLFLRIAKTTNDIAQYPVVMNRCNATHHGIVCDGCGTTAFQGYRFQCQSCPDMDFCGACEDKGVHDVSHSRVKIAVPRQVKQA